MNPVLKATAWESIKSNPVEKQKTPHQDGRGFVQTESELSADIVSVYRLENWKRLRAPG